MPVYHLPVQRTDSVSSSRYYSQGPARVSLSLATALVGPIALLVLVVSFIRNYKISSRSALVGLRAVTTPEESPFPSKQLRELKTRTMSKSTSGERDLFPLCARGSPHEEDRGDRGDLSSSPSIRKEGQDESAVMNADPNEPQYLKGRPPPATPLTPPVLSTTFFSFQDRRPSMAASVHGDFDSSLTQRPDSDVYLSESTATLSSNTQSSLSNSFPKKPYPRILPLDSLRLNASRDTGTEQVSFSSTFAPNSLPSSNPILPLAPHAALDPREMEAAGEALTVLNDSGHDWKRHTLVYGGGVCLACLASGGHGNDGGFYGENVPLDQRR
ncbi:hypothetical protein GGR50DRAFT_423204 [Xylaria sp. CBS 124048]|nr:hypothetical protein GGR50DRAFT_423204 [Xylaria sp. CBS 124048]